MGFDFSKFNPSEHLDNIFDVLPAGEYLVSIVDASQKKTRDGSGEYLVLTMEIIEGPYRGRNIWHNIMLVHQKDIVTRIGRRHLAELYISCGVDRVSSEQDLVNRTALVSVKVVKDEYGDLRNEVKGYKPIEKKPAPDFRDEEIPF
jgi:hypothetical protein